ncbi:MAG: ComEA family DNA-binding protein [Bacteroidota bacterium]
MCVISTFAALVSPIALTAQSKDENRGELDRIIERAVSELDPETSARQITELVELLENLANNPVNINRAGIDRLSEIPAVDLQLAQAIIKYRTNSKPFETTEELMQVPGIGQTTYRQLQPFVITGTGLDYTSDVLLNRKFWTSNSAYESLTRFQRVLQEREGYSRPDSLGGYLGQPFSLNHRFRYSSSHLSAAVTMDKDPGEPLKLPNEFDYTSWHIAAEDAGILKSLVIGDYRASFGQGLVLWNGGSFGKSSQVRGSAIKSDPGIRPYTSAQETNAFHGIAATVGGAFQLTGFYSNRKRTASEVSNQAVRMPSKSGLHRTESEISRRQNLGQRTVGGRIRYQFSRGIIGVSGYQNDFDRVIEKGSQPYQLHQFSGKRHSVIGADFRVIAGSVTLFGEAARSVNGSAGLIAGAELSPAAETDIALAYRNYAPDFQTLFGSGFGEQSGTQNEEGLYAGLAQALGTSFHFSAYFDLYTTKAASFGNSRPVSGTDWLTRIEFRPGPDLSLYAQLKNSAGEQEYSRVNGLGRSFLVIGTEQRSVARLHLSYQIIESVRLRTRLDGVRYQSARGELTYGFLIFQDLRFTPSEHLILDLRTTLFDTDDFNSRVFQFENDLLYVMSNTMLFHQGRRIYAVMSYEPAPAVRLRMKASTTLYENRPVIGSGLDEIEGNRRSDIGVQVQINF